MKRTRKYRRKTNYKFKYYIRNSAGNLIRHGIDKKRGIGPGKVFFHTLKDAKEFAESVGGITVRRRNV